MADKKLKTAVVGVGIGHLHIEGYQKSEGADLVAICDINEARGRATAEKYGVPRFYPNHEALFENEELDAVSVAVPNNVHHEIAIAAMEKGVAVLCEKPMANSLENAMKIADVAKARNATFMMAYNNRYRHESRLIKQLIEKGDLGHIYFGKCGWVRRAGIPGMGGWFTTKAISGGGPMLDIGVHALDLALWLKGFPKVTSVSGVAYSEFGPRNRGIGEYGLTRGDNPFDVEDLAAGFVRFEDGSSLIVEVSWVQYIPEERMFVSIFGTEGGADINPFRIYKDDQNGKPADYSPEVELVSGHHNEVLYFVDCLQKGITPDGTVDQGITVMRILDAMYRSAESGEEIRL